MHHFCPLKRMHICKKLTSFKLVAVGNCYQLEGGESNCQLAAFKGRCQVSDQAPRSLLFWVNARQRPAKRPLPPHCMKPFRPSTCLIVVLEVRGIPSHSPCRHEGPFPETSHGVCFSIFHSTQKYAYRLRTLPRWIAPIHLMDQTFFSADIWRYI